MAIVGQFDFCFFRRGNAPWPISWRVCQPTQIDDGFFLGGRPRVSADDMAYEHRPRRYCRLVDECIMMAAYLDRAV